MLGFPGSAASAPLLQFLGETRELLQNMIRVVNMRDTVLVTLSVVSDMAYAWLAISDYSPLMRMRIQRNPFSVLKLRATFLKLVSILDAPLVRINEANSPDLPSVSQYYSTEVAKFMRAVLQVIPENMFAILSEVVRINADEMSELPVKVVRTELRDWSQLEPRSRLARATHRVSVLTEGVLAMQSTVLGTVEIDPKELLEEGIRTELVRQLSHALQQGLTFKSGKPAELEVGLRRLSGQLQGFQLALEYISDYIKIPGLKLWQEELAGVLNFYVEQERNAFLKRRVHSWQSTFTRAAAAANHAPPMAFEHSFFGRLVRELVLLTSPRRSIYSEALSGWVDPQGREAVGSRLLHLLQISVGRCGLRGVGSTLGFMVSAQLHRFVRVYTALVSHELLAGLDALERALTPTSTLPDKPQKQYSAVATLGARLMAEMHETVWRCGAAQLLRAHVALALGGSTRIDCSLLATILANADAALLAELRADELRRARHTLQRRGGAGGEGGGGGGGGQGDNVGGVGAVDVSDPGRGALGATGERADEDAAAAASQSALREAAADLSPYVDAAGLGHPKEEVLLMTPALPRLPLALAVFTHVHLSKVQWSASLAALCEPKGKLTDESIDGVPLVTGVVCILRQFHAEATAKYVEYLLQLLRSMLHSAFSSSSKPAEPPLEAVTLLHYLEIFSRHASVEVPGLDLYQTAVGLT